MGAKKNELTPVQKQIIKICKSVEKTLLEKNRRYGNSALEPINIFSKLSASEGILQRIDDKLMRIKTADKTNKNDVFDLIGYCTLLSVQNEWDFKDLID